MKFGRSSAKRVGIRAALISAVCLGMAPVFGKQAILAGMPPLAVVALRTSLAAGLMVIAVLLINRRNFYIYPAGLLGCLLAGGINGIGSLFYYSALGRIDASLGQLLYALYPLFVALWMRLDGQKLERTSLIRLLLVIPAVLLLTQGAYGRIDLIGVVMMLVASALYALHLPINQRVLYDMPPQTVTLYTLIAMSAVVVPAYLLSGPQLGALMTAGSTPNGWGAVLGLTLVTFVSRLTLFTGVKHLGGLQTAVLGLGELLMTLFVSHFWLGETFTIQQWLGAGLLLVVLVLVGQDRSPTTRAGSGRFFGWLNPTPSPRELPVDLP
jgi:drug/metabolite transporter (DMT)-like permease